MKMNRLFKLLLVSALAFLPPRSLAQDVQPVKTLDQRFKADILVVVAHPDDEAAVTPYLARAIYDEHKRVAVVYATRGGSGANEYRRETGPALAEVREQEARQACAALGITDVWFLDGKDTASQNVLNSLANWGHGKNLEEMVRLVRLTRPEVIITWLPGIFIGENHGDHQAAGVLATEAFDLASDPAVFSSQVAGASKRLEPYLESLSPWQPKKIYYFSDAADSKQFAGTGPAYSVKEISPSQKKPYWRLALDAAKFHLTQFPGEIQQLSKMSDAQLEQLMDDPDKAWWSDPMTLIFGKSLVSGKATDDVFAHVTDRLPNYFPRSTHILKTIVATGQLQLGGPWAFYAHFRAPHDLASLPAPQFPEIGIKAGTTLSVPLVLLHDDTKSSEVELKVNAPESWKVTSGAGKWLLPAENSTDLTVEIETPALSPEALKTAQPQDVIVSACQDGKSIGEVKLRVKLQANALPQN
jgi:LmbE family N-acetylglucosaminyl deacetylase